MFLVFTTVILRNMRRDKKTDSIEKRVLRRQKREKIQNIVLAGVYVSAALGLAMAAPNSLQLLKYVQKYIGPKPNLERRISQALIRLRARGLLSRTGKISGRGRKLAESFQNMERVRPRKQMRWDRKWRIVIFDIWERRRNVRDHLRSILGTMGFVKIQNSVWVNPYPCEELLVLLRDGLRLGKGIVYIVADEIENDRKLRQHFGLPLS